MYGTRELNEKRLRLLKEYKGKFYAKDHGRFSKHGLFKVTGVIVNKDTSGMRLVLKEVKQKHQFNSMFGEYSELKVQRDMYFISPIKLGKEYLEVTDKDEKFNIAESLN